MAIKLSSGQNIPPLAWVVVGVLFLCAGVGIGYLGIYQPQVEQLRSTRQALARKTQELSKLQRQEEEYKAFADQKAGLETQLSVLQSKIPSTANELNHFLDSVNQRARSSRITNWTLFKQEGIIANGEISTIPIRMEFTASYDAAIQFFWDLASMGDGMTGSNREQLINIHDLTMTRENTRNEDTEPQVRVTCVAETYLYNGATAPVAVKN